MKKLQIVILLLCVFASAFAQIETNSSYATVQDYERYIEERLEMDFRLAAYETMNLKGEEINIFSPIFNQYMADKEKFAQKKIALLEGYAEEMSANNSAKEEAEETSDLLEDYWKLEISEAELRKDYFDRLADKIPYQKALDFFMFEKAVENKLKYEMLMPAIPAIVKMEQAQQLIKSHPEWTPSSWKQKPAYVSQKDYQRYIDKRLEMDFRLASIDAMELTSAEINRFNPIFDRYILEKETLTEKKFTRLDAYKKELIIEDNKAERAEESADYIEDYWGIEIAEMKLKENYYEIMEHSIPYNKAIQFFLFEEVLENQIMYDILVINMPTLILLHKNKKEAGTNRQDAAVTQNLAKADINNISSSIKDKMTSTSPSTINTPALPKAPELTKLDSWLSSNKGQMALAHNYTSSGLKATANAIAATAQATNTNIPNWDSKKAKIENVANTIIRDPYSTMHADEVGEAFVIIGEAIQTLNETNDYTYANGQVSLANHWASVINSDILLLKQSNKVYGFFGAANQALQEIWWYAVKPEPYYGTENR